MAPEAGADDDSIAGLTEGKEIEYEEDWKPGQDVEVNHKDILEILTANLDSPLGKSIHMLVSSFPGDMLTSSRGGQFIGIFTVDRRVTRYLSRRSPAIRS
jgi:hypothetical protein